MSTSGLLSPITINTLVVRNRAVMPSMLTNFATKGGDVTERLIHYYAERAKGGVGLVSIEGTAVEPRGTAFIRGISAADDSKIKGLSKLAKAIKAHGARASLQLIHGGRCVNPAISGFATPMVSYVPRFCSHAESVVLDAGVGRYIVDLHAAGSPAGPALGGRFRHAGDPRRARLPDQPVRIPADEPSGGRLREAWKTACVGLAVIRAIRKAVGDDFPISYRHNADDGLPGGMTLEETLQLVNPLVDAGVDALHISAGISGAGSTSSLRPPVRLGVASDAARQVKRPGTERVPSFQIGRYVRPPLRIRSSATARPIWSLSGAPSSPSRN